MTDRKATDRGDDGGGAVQHRVFTHEEDLPRRHDDGTATQGIAMIGRAHELRSGRIRAAGPGDPTIVRSTPGVAARAASMVK